jgi:hypothetical protein
MSFAQMHNDYLDPDRYLDNDGPEDETVTLTPDQAQELAKLKKAFKEITSAGPDNKISWAAYWNAFNDLIPEWNLIGQKDWELEDEEGGDSYPVWNEDAEKWDMSAHLFIHGRDDYGLFIRVKTWDGDCNWDNADEARETDTQLCWDRFQENYTCNYHFFRQWAEYFIWSIENGCVDPVQTYWKKDNCTYDDLVKSAWDHLNAIKPKQKS